MYFPDEIERRILHDSTDRTKVLQERPLIKYMHGANPATIHTPERRKIGGSQKNGVSTLKPAKLLQSSSMSGGSKRKPTAWQTLIKNTMKKGMTMKEAIKHIKDNKLY
jgi:hypothetical protein